MSMSLKVRDYNLFYFFSLLLTPLFCAFIFFTPSFYPFAPPESIVLDHHMSHGYATII